MSKTGLVVLKPEKGCRMRQHATGFFIFHCDLTEIYFKFWKKKINAAHHKAKGVTLENKQINRHQHQTKFDHAEQVTVVPLFLDGNWTLDHDEKFAGQFSIWDVNKDSFIDADEVTTIDSVQSVLRTTINLNCR